MPEKELNTQNQTVVSGEVDDMTPDYLAAIKELKENSVDRSKYEELRAENKKLLNSIVNGQVVESSDQPQHRDVNVIREELFNHEHNNLDYMKLTLELRNALISSGERDPFLPYGAQIAPTPEDEMKAEKAAEIYQECIDYANGDSKLFTQELQRRTNPSIYDRVNKR